MAPPSSGPLPQCRKMMSAHSFRADPQNSTLLSHHQNIGGPKGGWATIACGASTLSPTGAIAGPSGSSTLLTALHWGPLVPAASLNWHFLLSPSSTSTWQNFFQLGNYGFSLPSGAPKGLSSLSPLWDELFRSLKVHFHGGKTNNLLFH